MISFLDRTFCASKNCEGKCGRQWTLELQQRADKWAEDMGMEHAPVAFSTFCGEEPDFRVIKGG